MANIDIDMGRLMVVMVMMTAIPITVVNVMSDLTMRVIGLDDMLIAASFNANVVSECNACERQSEASCDGDFKGIHVFSPFYFNFELQYCSEANAHQLWSMGALEQPPKGQIVPGKQYR
jgi:hypothetical protein